MQLNNEKAFLALVRAGLWEQDVRLSEFEHIDLSEIYRLAEEQSVVGLVASGLEHVGDVKLPQVEVLQFVGQALQLEQRNLAMNGFIGLLIEKFRKAGIYAILVKGQGIAQCYERPLWRACGDVDLLLSDSNYSKAKDYLAPLASAIETESPQVKHLGMTIDNWTVELHGTLHCGLSSRMDKVIDEAQDDVFSNGEVRVWTCGETQVFLPSADNDIIFIFTHFLKHFYKGGLGLRQICDWCRLLWTFRDVIDVPLLESRLKKMRLISEWKAFGAFAVDYVGLSPEAMPLYSSAPKWSRKAEMICSFVMEVGNMGHNRDRSFYSKPYLVRKMCSFGRRCGDLARHARLFPMDSLRFFPSIVFNGVRSAARGE